MVVKVIIQSGTNNNIEFEHITTLTAAVASGGTYDFTPDLPASSVYLIFASTYSTYFKWSFGFNSTESLASTNDVMAFNYLNHPVKISWISVHNDDSTASNLSIIIGWN